MKFPTRNVFLIILAILLVGGAFFFAEYRNKQANSIYVAPKVTASSNNPSAELDTDNDGMKDWEEILVGTDPKDPKSKASLTSSTSITQDLTKENKEKLTQTDLISRDFFARYMELRQLGSAGDAFSQDELVSKTIRGIVLPVPKSYVSTDIKTKTDTSKEAIKAYGNDIASIFARNAIKSRNEAVIAKDALETEDLEKLKEIDPIIKSYKNIINSLLDLPAPSAVATLHLDLINSVNHAIFVAESLRKVEQDPISALQGVNLYQVAEKNLRNSVLSIKSYYSYLGIYFEPSEPGYIFRS